MAFRESPKQIEPDPATELIIPEFLKDTLNAQNETLRNLFEENIKTGNGERPYPYNFKEDGDVFIQVGLMRTVVQKENRTVAFTLGTGKDTFLLDRGDQLYPLPGNEDQGERAKVLDNYLREMAKTERD